MATAHERLIEWLRDAYATEEQAKTMLRRTASQNEDYPAFRAGLERHGELSAHQANRLKSCLDELGESTSLVKNLTGQLTALGQTLSGYVVGDEPAKAVLATATFAHMEVASYRILASAAAAAGEPRVAEICQGLLDEELQFARWLDEQIASVTTEYLSRESGGKTAKSVSPS